MSNKKPTYQDLEKEIIKLKSENEILQSNDRFNMLSKASDDMITVHQPDGKYLYYNGPTCYAISPKEIVGKMPEDIFNKDVSKRLMSAFKKVNKTGESVTIEVLLDWLGEKKWFSEYIYPFKNAKGEVIEIVKVCKDIHQRKIAQQEVENQNIALLGSAKELKASNKAFHKLNKELHNSNKKLTSAKEILEKSEINLRTLMNTIPDLIWLKSEDGRYLFVNNRFEEFFGAKEQDIIGKTDYDFVDKELADLFRINDKKAIYNGTSSVNEETVVFANDNHVELLETTKVPVISNDNSIVGVLGIGRDITAERKAEKTLKASNKAYRKLNQELKISNKKLSNAKNIIEKSETNLRTLMNTIPDLIWLKSEDGKYLFVNNRFEDFFGAKEQDIVGKTDYEFVDKEVADFYIEKDKEAISSGVANVSEDYAIFANDNHGELLETTKVPVISKDNSVIGVLGFARNITAKKKAENLTQKLSSIGNWQWNLKTGEAEWSEEMYKIYGQSKETFYPSRKNVMSVILREDLKTFRQNMALLYTDEIFYPFEFRIKRPSGKIRHLLSMSAEKKSEDITFGLIKDITRKKEREKEKENFLLKLEKTKNELNKAQKLGQIGSFQWNLTTDTSEWSEEMYKIYGQSKETFHPSHQNIMSVILRKDLKKVNQNIELLFADEMFSPLEFRIKRPSGEIRHLTLMSAEKSPENIIYGLIKDITEKKQLEKEKEKSLLKLEKTETELFEAQKLGQIGSWLLNPKNKKMEWSEETYHIWGFDFNKNIPKYNTIINLIHPDDFEFVMNSVKIVSTMGIPFDIKFRICIPNRPEKTLRSVCNPVRDANGNIVNLKGTNQDITEQVNQEKKVLKVGLESRAMKSAVDLGWSSAEFTMEGIILRANYNFVTDFGYSSKKEFIGKHHKIFYDPSYENSDSYERFWKELANGKEQKGEFKRIKKDGSTIWIHATYTPVKDVNGNYYKVIKIANDISEMVTTRYKITAIANELRQFIETANAPIFGIDSQGLVNEWNQTSEKITGFTKQEVLGKDLVQTYIRPDDQEAVKKVLDNALVGLETANFEFPLFTKNKERVMVLLNSSTRKNANGDVTGVLGVGQDITELVGYRNQLELKVNQRTLKLNEALKKEKELRELKSKFVSTASHEFRTPLSSINFAAGSIKKYWSKMEPNVIEKKLHKIEDQVMHMTKLLDDILIVGQAEAGKIMYNPIHLNLGDFIYEIIEEVGNSHNKRHKILLIDDEKLKNTSIFIDEKLGRNIFINIISNAVKFSPDADTVTVEFSTEKNYTVISVIDFGIGIPKAELSNIFNPFIRGENVDLIQGTGLGLSIVKEAVDALGGKIIVNSKIGKGTSFLVKIPKNSK